jgi:hypothetical protein
VENVEWYLVRHRVKSHSNHIFSNVHLPYPIRELKTPIRNPPLTFKTRTVITLRHAIKIKPAIKTHRKNNTTNKKRKSLKKTHHTAQTIIITTKVDWPNKYSSPRGVHWDNDMHTQRPTLHHWWPEQSRIGAQKTRTRSEGGAERAPRPFFLGVERRIYLTNGLSATNEVLLSTGCESVQTALGMRAGAQDLLGLQIDTRAHVLPESFCKPPPQYKNGLGWRQQLPSTPLMRSIVPNKGCSPFSSRLCAMRRAPPFAYLLLHPYETDLCLILHAPRIANLAFLQKFMARFQSVLNSPRNWPLWVFGVDFGF